MYGDADRLCDAETALEAALEIAGAFPSIKEVKPYAKQVANLLGEYHPAAVGAVAFGRNSIQRRSTFPPSLVEIRAAVSTEQHRRFGICGVARLALAFIASERCPSVRRSLEWEQACDARDGDKALAMVGEAMKSEEV